MTRLLQFFAALLGLFAATPACAGDVDLFGPDTLSFTADLRLAAANGEKSWVDGGFGKLRFGDEVSPRLGNADLVWQPRLGWAVSATVAGSYVGGERPQAGISEAFLSVKPRLGGKVHLAARAGLLWPAISTEHEGADWHVADTITPSAINSWVAEEVRPLAVEARLDTSFGDHQISLTGGTFMLNDTAGTLLALRGWALHDRKTLAGRKQPLPPLPDELIGLQPRYTHPLINVGWRFASPDSNLAEGRSRPGYYAKLAWAPPLPVRFEAFRYDNRANPAAINDEFEWGWRTRFNQVAAVANLSPTLTLKTQAMSGRSLMGFPDPDRLWVDHRFRSAFVLIANRTEKLTIAGRAELFDGRQRGTYVTSQDDEHGWAGTLAVQRPLAPGLVAVAEYVHVRSVRDARLRAGIDAHQSQDQVQLAVRARW